MLSKRLDKTKVMGVDSSNTATILAYIHIDLITYGKQTLLHDKMWICAEYLVLMFLFAFMDLACRLC